MDTTTEQFSTDESTAESEEPTRDRRRHPEDESDSGQKRPRPTLAGGRDADSVAEVTAAVEAVEDELQRQRDRIEALERALAREREQRQAAIRDEQIQRTRIVQTAKSDLTEDIEAVRDDLVGEQKTRSRADARIEKRLSHVADEAGVGVEDAVADDDKLMRLIRHGPADIVNRAYPVHERARELLVHARNWGTYLTDGNGERLVFVAPDVKPYLEARFDRTFSTSELERVFAKLAAFAEDSPRRVRKGKNRDGHHQLVVWRPKPLLEAAGEVSG